MADSQELPLNAPTRNAYIPGLDGVRAIAFLMVFWAHALPGISYYIPATLGVTVFFFLSGYLITTLLRRELASTGTIALRDFYLRRALRIFIPLYVVYALTAAFAHFAQHESMGNWRGFCALLFYYYNYTVALGIKAWVPLGMNVIWSLCVEEHFYLLFPLAYLAMARSRLTRSTQTRLLVGFCLLELAWRYVLIAVLHVHNDWTYYATDARLDSVLWGSVLALTNNPVFVAVPTTAEDCHPEQRNAVPLIDCHPERSAHSLEDCHPERSAHSLEDCHPEKRSDEGPASPDCLLVPPRHAFLAFLGGLALLIASLLPRSILYKESLRYTLQALALYLIFSFVIPNIRHPSVAWLEWKPLRYLGWISYVLYLSHDFILNVLTRRWPDRLWLTGPLGFVIAIAFATLMRYTLELPLQRLRARLRHLPGPLPDAPRNLPIPVD